MFKKKFWGRILAMTLGMSVMSSSCNVMAAGVDVSDLTEWFEELGFEEISGLDELEDNIEVFEEMLKERAGQIADIADSLEEMKQNKLNKLAGMAGTISEVNFDDISEDATYLNWNTKMVHAENNDVSLYGLTDTVSEEKVKVAIIDSGVNYSSDIDVKERKDFINGTSENDISVLYEDFSGHGTSIAGVIAAKDNDTGITGINPDVELYSARVLDMNNEAPVERVVEAIEWAIEKDVNIINLSFTTSTDSEELREVIQKAYNEGILLVAAAGNEGYVAYPAAYPEVIAVGSVDSNGAVSSFSPISSGIELVAPGELITATDCFETLSTHSGTSFATPHVTAIASKLWERDMSVSASYIRCVLDISANMWTAEEGYGYGLVDYEFACEVFDALKPFAKYSDRFDLLMSYAIDVCGIYNPNTIPVSENDEEVVEGAWWLDDEGQYEHMSMFDGLELKNANGRAILMAGCVISDMEASGLSGMTLNPYFHGYAFYIEDVDGDGKADQDDSTAYHRANYIAGYLYLTKIAKAMLSGNVYNTYSGYVAIDCDDDGVAEYSLNNIIDNEYLCKSENVTWDDVDTLIGRISGSKSNGRIDGIDFNPDNKIHRALIIYGLSLHSLADIFAHSSVANIGGQMKLIRHTTYNNIEKIADSVKFIPERNEAATKVCCNALRLISKMSDTSDTSNTAYSSYGLGNISVFELDSYSTEFQLVNFSRYIKQVCTSNLFKNDNTYSETAGYHVWNSGDFYNWNVQGYYYSTEKGKYVPE